MKKINVVFDMDGVIFDTESYWAKAFKKASLRFNKDFDEEAINNLNLMADAVSRAYDVMIENLTAAHKGELVNISNAYSAEEQLNVLRNNLRDAVIEDIENDGKNYQTSVYYMDIVNEYEHMGDFMINVSQDLERAFIRK